MDHRGDYYLDRWAMSSEPSLESSFPRLYRREPGGIHGTTGFRIEGIEYP